MICFYLLILETNWVLQNLYREKFKTSRRGVATISEKARNVLTLQQLFVNSANFGLLKRFAPGQYNVEASFRENILIAVQQRNANTGTLGGERKYKQTQTLHC